MSLKHLSLSLLLLSTVFLADDTSATAPTAQGPVTPAEASVLFQEGKAAFLAKNYTAAMNELTRFVDRYPGQPGYLEAHLILGRTLLEMDRPKDALKPLKYFIQGTRDLNQATYAKLFLTDAYLRLHDANEALLLAEEIGKTGTAKNIDFTTVAEGLLYKAQAAFDLKQFERAAASLSSEKAYMDPRSNSFPETVAHSAWIDLQLRLHECSLLPSSGPLEEDQVLNQMERRGNCMNEASLIYRDLLQTQSMHWSELATSALIQAFNQYQSACSNPPAPPELKGPKKRTSAQLKRYHQELRDRLLRDYKSRLTESVSILTGLHSSLPKDLASFSDQVLQTLLKGQKP